jgi:hypothetical protein
MGRSLESRKLWAAGWGSRCFPRVVGGASLSSTRWQTRCRTVHLQHPIRYKYIGKRPLHRAGGLFRRVFNRHSPARAVWPTGGSAHPPGALRASPPASAGAPTSGSKRGRNVSVIRTPPDGCAPAPRRKWSAGAAATKMSVRIVVRIAWENQKNMTELPTLKTPQRPRPVSTEQLAPAILRWTVLDPCCQTGQ